MPNIFGKTVADYVHLQRIQSQGLMDAHNAHLQRVGRVHDFNALPDIRMPKAMPFNDTEANAQAIHFVTNNLQAIQAEIEEILYLDFRLNEMIPIVENIPEGARTYSYRVVNKYGQGSFIDNSGKDANSAHVSLQNVPYSLAYGGIIPSWTLEDLRAAAFTGIALDTEVVGAGTTGCMDHIEKIGISGDSAYGFTGLVNDPNIPSASASKTIANMTADEMVTFVQTQVAAIIAQTQEIFSRVVQVGLTVYLPIAQEALIGDTKLADDASKTVWEYVKTNNQWTRRTGKDLMLQPLAELDGAGDAATDRAIFGFNDKRVMEMAMPISPRVVQTINTHYGVDVPMEYKISGLNVKHPNAMRYVDGI